MGSRFLQGELRLLVSTTAGGTGLVAVVCLLFIVLPMVSPYLKRRISWEWRKVGALNRTSCRQSL